MMRRIRYKEFLPWKVLYFLTRDHRSSLPAPKDEASLSRLETEGRNWEKRLQGIGYEIDIIFDNSVPVARMKDLDRKIAELASNLARFPAGQLRSNLVAAVSRCVMRSLGIRMKNSEATATFHRLIRQALQSPDCARFLLANGYWRGVDFNKADFRDIPCVERFIEEHNRRFPVHALGAVIAHDPD